ncbi:MAG: preprotein translocase subunit SecG [Mycoplasmataceae bacterium]|jgi:preprotein translocase subunit SecG|nr:preprotein translocase subunit SecG [Mycoplasmataceae bacterium]
MGIFTIIMAILSIICLVIGLLLSGSGTTSGLTVVVGQDLELFKKTKDRGLIKILQMIMFLLMIVLFVLSLISMILS